MHPSLFLVFQVLGVTIGTAVFFVFCSLSVDNVQPNDCCLHDPHLPVIVYNYVGNCLKPLSLQTDKKGVIPDHSANWILDCDSLCTAVFT